VVLAVAEANFAQAQAQRTQAKELLHELSAAYHPYDLDSGQAQPPERVAQRLRACWDPLTQRAERSGLARALPPTASQSPAREP
jgi:hypothetical protein